MSNFDLTFFKVYIYAKGWPDTNLGASQESCAHPTVQSCLKMEIVINYSCFM